MDAMKINLNKLAAEIHAVAVEKGFWDVEEAEVKHIAKTHSELSEAVQADRAGVMYQPEDSISGKPEGVAVELADFVMMVLDFLAKMDVDIDLFLCDNNLDEFRKVTREDLSETSLPEFVVMQHRCLDKATLPENFKDFRIALTAILWGVPYWMELHGFDIWEIIDLKMKINANREKLHGRLY